MRREVSDMRLMKSGLWATSGKDCTVIESGCSDESPGMSTPGRRTITAMLRVQGLDGAPDIGTHFLR
jgi:hypothetical protein